MKRNNEVWMDEWSHSVNVLALLEKEGDTVGLRMAHAVMPWHLACFLQKARPKTQNKRY